MEQKEKKDWSQEISMQIAVYKTDKSLLELCDSLKPASSLFPSHIHATGEKPEAGERSLIRLNMLDYSKGKGENTVSVYANISPEETKYIYSALFNQLMEFDYAQDKIFGAPDENGYSIVTKLQIRRYDMDNQGKKRKYPWFVEIQNGRGISAKNANGGRYCKKDSYICDKTVRLFINDKDMFVLFCKAEAFIHTFEQEYAFRENRVGNFNTLYQHLKTEIHSVAEYYEKEAEDMKTLKKVG